jgi:hypothetical protein
VKLHLLCLLVLTLACGTAAAEGFDGLTCGMDLAKALKGRHLPDEPSNTTDAKHKDIGLKGLGADELDWGSEVWMKMCGATYAMLVDQKALIRDVLKVPAEPGATLAFEGSCKGGPKDHEVIAVVEDKAGATDLPAKAAWMIDDAKKRYASVPSEGMLCPRGDGLVDSWK